VAISEENRKLIHQAGSIFTPGAPINERELFAGRLVQVQQILNAISQRGYHAALYGERGVGKTSLSNVLLEFLGGPGQIAFSRINCDATDTYSTLWRKALMDVTITIKKPGFGFTSAFTASSERMVDQLPEDIVPNDIRQALSELAKELKVVMIFDEFDRLKDKRATILMADTIKALSDYSVGATILIIGVADSVDALVAEHQSIERALVQVPMPRMSDEEISEIIEKGLHKLGMSIEEEANHDIVSLSQGLPYITHLLSLHCARAALETNSKLIMQTHVTKGIEKSLGQWQQSIKAAYYNATRSHQPGHIYKEVLLACALAEVDDLRYFTAASVRTPLRIITGRLYNIPNFAKHIKELSEPTRGSLLQRVGEKRRVRYRLESPMLRPYIIMRGVQEKIITKETLQEVSAAQSE
jgi:Cdc6-like AAA superfamily ATPase